MLCRRRALPLIKSHRRSPNRAWVVLHVTVSMMLLLPQRGGAAFAGAGGRVSFMLHDLRAATTVTRSRRRLRQLLPSRRSTTSSTEAQGRGTPDYSTLRCSSSASASSLDGSSSINEQHGEVDILGQVEHTVDNILKRYSNATASITSNNITSVTTSKQQRDAILHSLPPSSERECLGLAYSLHARLTAMRTHRTCRRCWLHPEHCICANAQSLEHALPASVNRIFVLAHHKEVGLLIDTAKLIFMAFPESARLVVSGLSAHYQESMLEFQQALQQPSTVILFPDAERAKTLAEWRAWDNDHHGRHQHPAATRTGRSATDEHKFDIVVIDGTWEQARRMYQRYMMVQSNDDSKTVPVPARRVQLSPESLASLASPSLTNDDDADDDANNNRKSSNTHKDVAVGQQLRRHPEPARQIATAHALQLLLQDVLVEVREDGDNSSSNGVAEASLQLKRLDDYQAIANAAARRQLPSVRYRKGKEKR